MNREVVVATDYATAAAAAFLAERPRTVALAGGHTPGPMYEKLRAASFAWSDVEIFFGDERCVPPDHHDSNFRMANETLLAYVPARVHRMEGEHCDAERYQRELASVFGDQLPAFDVVLLGLGSDGHTASLFPGDPALDERSRWVVHVRRPDHMRLTLTLPVLSAARVAMFLVAGEGKRDALSRLLAGDDIPAAHVAAAKVIVFADSAAAG